MHGFTRRVFVAYVKQQQTKIIREKQRRQLVAIHKKLVGVEIFPVFKFHKNRFIEKKYS